MKGLIMMIFKKLSLLFCLALGMCVPNTWADAITDAKINYEIHQAFHGKTVTLTTLKATLKILIPKIANLIAHKADGEYKELHEAIKELNLDEQNLLIVRAQLKKVVDHLPEKSKSYIKKKFPILG